MIFTTNSIINVYPNKKDFDEIYDNGMVRKLAFKQAKKVYVRVRLAEAQNWKCCFCGCYMTENSGKNNSVTIEHVTPRSKGGIDHDSNYAASCYKCNNRRGDMPWDDFFNRRVQMERDEDVKKHEAMLRRVEKYTKKALKLASCNWKVNEYVQSVEDWLNTLRVDALTKTTLKTRLAEVGVI